MIDDFTDHLLAFIEQNKSKPFFGYLPCNTPHTPFQVPDRFFDRFKSKEIKMRHRDAKKEEIQRTRSALALCENIDWNVGRILRKLDQMKIADDTIVVYFSDNGPNGWRWNGGMKGRKGSTDEGGVRSPMLIRWAGTIEAGKKVETIGAAFDLLPTLADLAAIKVASTKPLDGVSLKPLLLSGPKQWKDRFIFSHWRNRVSVRNQQYRFDSQGKLFDMRADPGQHTDISRRQPNLTRTLRAAVDDFKRNVLAGYDKDERPFVVGHPDFKYTQLPARDARWTGNIKRSNRFPNCSYLTNWTSLNDRINWEVEVPADGRFEVELHFACPKKDVGSEFELSFNGDSLRGRITEANDVLERGMESDRTPRVESYVKDWKSLKVGMIDLKTGRGTLTLRALKIPGEQAMDFRLLMLTRVRE